MVEIAIASYGWLLGIFFILRGVGAVWGSFKRLIDGSLD